MNNDGFFIGFGTGFILTAIMCTSLARCSGMKDTKVTADQLKQRCEQNLPRNQQCVMVYLPEKK